jgi:hypothetical protein
LEKKVHFSKAFSWRNPSLGEFGFFGGHNSSRLSFVGLLLLDVLF